MFGVIKDLCHSCKLKKLRNKNIKLMKDRHNATQEDLKRQLKIKLAEIAARGDLGTSQIDLVPPMASIKEEQESEGSSR